MLGKQQGPTYSTGNSPQYGVVTCNGKEHGKIMCGGVYITHTYTHTHLNHCCTLEANTTL